VDNNDNHNRDNTNGVTFSQMLLIAPDSVPMATTSDNNYNNIPGRHLHYLSYDEAPHTPPLISPLQPPTISHSKPLNFLTKLSGLEGLGLGLVM
jgi:hypothetical protein